MTVVCIWNFRWICNPLKLGLFLLLLMLLLLSPLELEKLMEKFPISSNCSVPPYSSPGLLRNQWKIFRYIEIENEKWKNWKTNKQKNFPYIQLFFVYFWIFTKNHKVCKMMKLKPKKTIQIQIEFLLMELLLLARNLHKCLLSKGIEHFQLRNYFDFQSATNDTSSWIIFFWKPMGIERKRTENKVRDTFWSFIRIGRIIH